MEGLDGLGFPCIYRWEGMIWLLGHFGSSTRSGMNFKSFLLGSHPQYLVLIQMAGWSVDWPNFREVSLLAGRLVLTSPRRLCLGPLWKAPVELEPGGWSLGGFWLRG